MANFLAPILNDQQENANGAPLSGGSAEVYLAGSSTPATTYSDQAGAVPNTWPVVFNTLGVNSQGPVWLTGGVGYKFIIKDSVGVVQRTIDNVTGINDTAITASQWVVFQGTPVFASGNSFTVPGDQTQVFTYGTRVRTVNSGGVVYGTVVSSTYVAPNTTVVIATDSGVLDIGLSQVSTGIISATNSSVPGTFAQRPFRNRILNGAFRIDQRNSGTPVVITAGAAIAYTLDRFYVQCTGGNVTVARTQVGNQFQINIAGSAGNTGTLVGTRIESFNCADWANKQIYCQIAATSTTSQLITWRAYVADATDNFAAKTQVGTGTFTANGQTAYFNFPAGPNAGRGVCIEFSSGTVLNAAFLNYLGVFQAEADMPTPFEAVPISEDIERCERYYLRHAVGVQGNIVSGSTYGGATQLRTSMRANPTVNFILDNALTAFPAASLITNVIGPGWINFAKVANGTSTNGFYYSLIECIAEL